MTSFFLEGKYSKTTYYTTSEETATLVTESTVKPLEFEMYNKTQIYIYPIDATKVAKAEFTFWVYQAEEF